ERIATRRSGKQLGRVKTQRTNAARRWKADGRILPEHRTGLLIQSVYTTIVRGGKDGGPGYHDWLSSTGELTCSPAGEVEPPTDGACGVIYRHYSARIGSSIHL